MASSFAQAALCPPLSAPLKSIVKISSSSPPVHKFTASIISSSIATPDSGEPSGVDPVKASFARAKAYKGSLQSPVSNDGLKKLVAGKDPITAPIDEKNEDSESEPPSSVKLAFEKAKEYKKKSNGVLGEGDEKSRKIGGKEGALSVSSLDFLGLDFSDKKETRGLPAGLVPVSDNFSEELEVEIIVGNSSNFADESPSSRKIPVEANDSESVYKPKVSTWGVFPRPSNISKTYGGGRNIRPGEALESKEERAAKDARTREFLAAYDNKIGVAIDKKLRLECEEALKKGDSLMDLGKLKEALPFYQEVMEKLPFKTELHGLAALQWSICQDSLSRLNEARTMYDKLQSHPSFKVSKRARQFFFGFKAMDIMKVSSSSASPKIGYEVYFDAFVKDKTSSRYSEPETDGTEASPAIPYMIFLLSPLLLLLLMASASKYHLF